MKHSNHFYVLILALVLLAQTSCTRYRVIRRSGCIAGIHLRVATFDVQKIQGKTTFESYLRMKKVLIDEGYTKQVIANDTNEVLSFSSNVDELDAQITLLNDTLNDELVLTIYDNNSTRYPKKSDFKRYCRETLERIESAYLSE